MKKIKITEELDIEEVIANLKKILYTENASEYKAITDGIKVIKELVNELQQLKEQTEATQLHSKTDSNGNILRDI